MRRDETRQLRLVGLATGGDASARSSSLLPKSLKMMNPLPDIGIPTIPGRRQ